MSWASIAIWSSKAGASIVVIVTLLFLLLPALVPDGNVFEHVSFDALIWEEVVLLEILLHPRVLLHLLQIESFLGILDQYPRNEVLGLGRSELPCLVVEVVLAVLDLLE